MLLTGEEYALDKQIAVYNEQELISFLGRWQTFWPFNVPVTDSFRKLQGQTNAEIEWHWFIRGKFKDEKG
jgi:hypothetical protein